MGAHKDTLYLVQRGSWKKPYTTLKRAMKAKEANPKNELYEYKLSKEIK